LIGQSLAHYEILDKIGQGGMGEVYRARDNRLGRFVAVKLLTRDSCSNPAFIERFAREAKAASSLNHPGICTIHDIGEHEGRPFIVMEYLEGSTLADELSAGPLPTEKMLDLALQIVDALAAAHAAGILHRDIKPANICVIEDGRTKLLDFGLATLPQRQVDPEAPTMKVAEPLTLPGMEFGTLGYMSPEQALGETLDDRSDLFSLGVVLYEMATGFPPFSGSTPAAIYDAILNRPADPPSLHVDQLPTALDDVILMLLNKDRAARYRSASALHDDLARIRSDPLSTPNVSHAALDQAREAARRHDWPQAFRLYQKLDQETDLAAEDLHRFQNVAFWAGQIELCVRVCERAHARFVEEGEPIRAGLMAAMIAEFNIEKGANSVGNGWLQRARGLLDDAPDSVECGHLRRLETRRALESGDLDTAERMNAKTRSIAQLTRNPALQTLAVVDEGQLLVHRGRVADGLAKLDEAMAIAVGSNVDQITMSRIYCIMIATCGLVGDYRRAMEWNDQAVQWCQPHRDSMFPGICCVHRAEILCANGEWEEAERQARKATGDLQGYNVEVVRSALYELGEIHLRRGDLDDAEDAFRRAHERGHNAMPGLSQLRLWQGKPVAAAAALTRTLAEARQPIQRLRLLPTSVEAALVTSDVDAAETQAEELQGLLSEYDAPVFTGAARHALGSVRLAQHRYAEASSLLRQALTCWHEAEMPYEAARTRLVLARAYRDCGEPEAAELEIETARSTFARLGAKLDLAVVGEWAGEDRLSRLMVVTSTAGLTGQSALLERRVPGQFAPDDEFVDRLGALVGDHALEVQHVSDRAELDADAACAQHVAGVASHIQRHPGVVPLRHRHLAGMRGASVLEAAQLQRQQLGGRDLPAHVRQSTLDGLGV
jgi:tetratricopeptide (TPR) repeat protein